MYFDQETREALKADHICVRCAVRPAREGLTTCAPCGAHDAEYHAEHRADLIARQLCTEGCGRLINVERSAWRCAECLVKKSTTGGHLRAGRRAQGLCWHCDAAAVDGKTLCVRHLAEHRERGREYMRNRRAGLRRIA